MNLKSLEKIRSKIDALKGQIEQATDKEAVVQDALNEMDYQDVLTAVAELAQTVEDPLWDYAKDLVQTTLNMDIEAIEFDCIQE